MPNYDQLNAEQKAGHDGICRFLSEPRRKGEYQAARVTGPPGSGKTTVATMALSTQPDADVLVTAPTNKATRQLRKMLTDNGTHFETMTIYKALGLSLSDNGEVKGIFQSGSDNAFRRYSTVITDEYSMLSSKVHDILSSTASRAGVKVLFLGDDDQLPPVKEVRSPVSAAVADAYQFSKIERSGSDNPVQGTVMQIRNMIRSGQYNPLNLQDDYNDNGGQYCFDAKKWHNFFMQKAAEGFEKDNMDVSRAIAYTNARVDQLNAMARKYIHGDGCPEFLTNETVIAATPIVDPETKEVLIPTDEEVVIMDAYEGGLYEDDIANTGKWKVWELTVKDDVGNIAELRVLHASERNRFESEKSKLANICRSAGFNGPVTWKHTFWPFVESFDSVKHPYAITAHRSQGSTYESVFPDIHNMLAFKQKGTISADMYLRLLYVAISRARYNVAFNHTVL